MAPTDNLTRKTSERWKKLAGADYSGSNWDDDDDFDEENDEDYNDDSFEQQNYDTLPKGHFYHPTVETSELERNLQETHLNEVNDATNDNTSTETHHSTINPENLEEYHNNRTDHSHDIYSGEGSRDYHSSVDSKSIGINGDEPQIIHSPNSNLYSQNESSPEIISQSFVGPEETKQKGYRLSEQPYDYNDEEFDDDFYEQEETGQVYEEQVGTNTDTSNTASFEPELKDEMNNKEWRTLNEQSTVSDVVDGPPEINIQPPVDETQEKSPKLPEIESQSVPVYHVDHRIPDDIENVSDQNSTGHSDPLELSDTDTLHIRGSESVDNFSNSSASNNDDAQIIHASDIEPSKSVDDFKELAYLGTFINAPKSGNNHPGKALSHDDADDENSESKDNISANLQSNDDESRTPILNRDSQFYSSLSDYVDDYAENESQDNEKSSIAETDHDYHDSSREEYSGFDLNHSLTKTITSHSSGSLSTGGPSIKSESVSNRATSFTNQSFQSQEDHRSINGDGLPTDDDELNKFNLNPAPSFNFGPWRPNTDRFRERFINASFPIPPVSKLDSYTRNSAGEIVEENDSIADSNISDIHSSAQNIDVIDVPIIDADTSAKAINVHDTYKTDSNSILPVHIPPSSSDASISDQKSIQAPYFKEHVEPEESTPSPTKSQMIRKRETKTNFDFKKVSVMSNPSMRIEGYRKIREEELNKNSGLGDWIKYAMVQADVVQYSSKNNAYVKQAYAEASSNPKKLHHNNLGGTLVKKTLHDTSSTASSFAKEIFSRGKKMIKNEHK